MSTEEPTCDGCILMKLHEGHKAQRKAYELADRMAEAVKRITDIEL